MARILAIGLFGFLTFAVQLPAQEKKGEPKEDLTIVGQIVPNDFLDKSRRHPCKIHTLKLSMDKAYVIDMESKDFDCFLRIENSEGKQLAQDDDGGEGLNSRLRFAPPKDDTYQIIATSFAGGAGTYTLKVRVVSAPAPVKAVVLKLADGKVQHQSELTKDDVIDSVRKRPCKIHTAAFAKGGTYVIDLESAAFDSYLRLEDRNGKQLAEDDDGGGFPHARIRFTAPEAGEYRIIATMLGAGAGRYTLKVRTDGTAPDR